MANGTHDYKAGQRDQQIEHLAKAVEDLTNRVGRLEKVYALGFGVLIIIGFIMPWLAPQIPAIW
jgi:hypothetical protein